MNCPRFTELKIYDVFSENETADARNYVKTKHEAIMTAFKQNAKTFPPTGRKRICTTEKSENVSFTYLLAANYLIFLFRQLHYFSKTF